MTDEDDRDAIEELLKQNIERRSKEAENKPMKINPPEGYIELSRNFNMAIDNPEFEEKIEAVSKLIKIKLLSLAKAGLVNLLDETVTIYTNAITEGWATLDYDADGVYLLSEEMFERFNYITGYINVITLYEQQIDKGKITFEYFLDFISEEELAIKQLINRFPENFREKLSFLIDNIGISKERNFTKDSREALELIVEWIHQRKNIKREKDPTNLEDPLEKNIRVLSKNGILNSEIYSSMETIRRLGNTEAHAHKKYPKNQYTKIRYKQTLLASLHVLTWFYEEVTGKDAGKIARL